MSKITEYKIVMAMSPADLVKQVNQLITEGWIPTGGLVISQSPISKQEEGGFVSVETISQQAMVKLQIF